MKSLEARLEKLEAEKTIEALATQYCLACDSKDIDGLMALFCEDAEIQIPAFGALVQGISAIREVFMAEFGALGRTFHWTHDRMITSEGSDHAHGMILAHAEVMLDGRTNIAAMRYDDRYRRNGHDWRFAFRKISFHYYLPLTDYDKRFGHVERLFRGGTWVSGDPVSKPIA